MFTDTKIRFLWWWDDLGTPLRMCWMWFVVLCVLTLVAVLSA